MGAGLYGYIYPGSRRAVGPVTAKAGLYWAPDQHYFKAFATRSRYSIYEYGESSSAVPGVPLALHAHVGHTGGGLDYVGRSYIDYTVGAGCNFKAPTFDLSVVGTDLSRRDTAAADLAANTTDSRRAAKVVLVGSVTASF